MGQFVGDQAEQLPAVDSFRIRMNNQRVGSVYLSKQNEIGIFLLKEYQGLKLGKNILELLMEKNPAEMYLANVSPKNHRSINFFKKNKFRLIQYTFEFIPRH